MEAHLTGLAFLRGGSEAAVCSPPVYRKPYAMV